MDSKETITHSRDQYTLLQELKGFSFATALDLNMSYYTIRLDKDASKILTVIFL